tara:strand:- start:1548 stop:2273 length:726 start_codon:yes stop_codon:yes gene_type:complete
MDRIEKYLMNSYQNIQDKGYKSIAKLKSVSLQYKDGPKILDSINLEIMDGSFHFLTGASGSGKTSFLSMLYLAILPSEGIIKLFDYNILEEKRIKLAKIRHKIGVVFQDFRLLDHLSVFDNVALPLRILKSSEEEIEDDVRDLLSWVGLDKLSYSYPPMLSGGQKQMVAICRSIITKPKLLIADEPTGSVDEEIASRLMQLFIELNKIGTTIIIATHNDRLVKKYDFPQFYIKNKNILLND